MKEIIKSKVMISFIVVVLSIVFINSNVDSKMDENTQNEDEIAVNL